MARCKALELFQEYRVAKFVLPLKSGEKILLDGVLRSRTPTSLIARFLPDQLPVENLLADGECRVTCMAEMCLLHLRARIKKAAHGRHLFLDLNSTWAFPDPRQHSRFTTEIAMKYWLPDEKPPAQAIVRKVDISGSGVRFSTPLVLLPKQEIVLELSFPATPSSPVQCKAQVVRVTKSKGQMVDVALRFTEIDRHCLEIIIDFCLLAEFRHMQNKALFLGNVLTPV